MDPPPRCEVSKEDASYARPALLCTWRPVVLILAVAALGGLVRRGRGWLRLGGPVVGWPWFATGYVGAMAGACLLSSKGGVLGSPLLVDELR